MLDSMITMTLYALPATLIWSCYVGARMRRSRQNEAVQRAFLEAGLTEPASLHPIIDHSRCVGCGSCVAACPEHPSHKVLGLIGGKAHLIGPADCIGHGACKTACPRGAVTLVFGTERRGVDIPKLTPDFETDVPGIFIAGELGGMGLIRNAIVQGRQAVDAITKLDGIGHGPDLDLVIVGAGPAGFSATLRAMELKLRAVTLEQETLGGTVSHYPRGKVVMTTPVDLPLVGRVKFVETTKEVPAPVRPGQTRPSPTRNGTPSNRVPRWGTTMERGRPFRRPARAPRDLSLTQHRKDNVLWTFGQRSRGATAPTSRPPKTATRP